VLDQIWQSLSDAVHMPGHDFALLNLATVGLDGDPKARFVILREVSRSREYLGFATHTGSTKVAEIRAIPAVAATFYNRNRLVQLRLEGVAQVVEEDAERWRAWQTLAPHTQEQYATLSIPGEPVTDGPPREDPATAFQRFAWIEIRPQRMEWLDLSTQPHHRWLFVRDANQWFGQRVIP